MRMKEESICFNCKHSTSNKDVVCPWANDFKPVEGWEVAEGVKINYQDGRAETTVRVCSCPLYEREFKYFEFKDILELITNYFHIGVSWFYRNHLELIRQYEKETGEILPEWCKWEDVK